MRLSTRFSLLFDIDFLLSSVFDFLLQTPRQKSMVETEHGSTKTTEQTGPIQHCLTNFRSKQKSPCSLPFQDYYQRPIRGFTAVAQCLSLPKMFPWLGVQKKRAANFANKHESNKIW